MQANRQNTRQLAAGAQEIMEWFTQGAEWSILNYGPGILWFSYTPGVDASPGEVQSTKLEPGYSFTDSASAPRFLQLSLTSEAGGLTYCLNTNQRYGAGSLPPGGGTGDVEEAPLDGVLYGRRNATWQRAVNILGDTMTGPLIINSDPQAVFALNGEEICAIILGRFNEPRWILGAAHLALPDRPNGLYFARMNSDGSAILDFPFSIRRPDGHCVLHETECEAAYKTGNLDIALPNEYVTRHFLESSPTRMAVLLTGDTMTGTLRIEGGGLIIRQFAPPAFGDAVIRMEAGEASLILLVDGTNTVRFTLGAAFAGAQTGFAITRGGPPFTPIRDFFIDPTNGRVSVRGLVVTGDVAGTAFRINGPTSENAEISFSENDSGRWSIVGQYIPTAPKGPGLYFYRMNGGQVLGEALFLSHGDGRVEMEGGAIIRGDTVLAGGRFEITRPNGSTWNLANVILAHAEPGNNQTLTPGESTIVFINHNTPGNGGFRIGRLALNQTADELVFKEAIANNPLDIRGRNISATAQPTANEHLTRRDYVDTVIGPGPIQTISVQGAGWAGTATLRYRHLQGGGLVQIIGQLQRAAGASLPPYNPPTVLPTQLCILPVGYRPLTLSQMQLCPCVAEADTNTPAIQQLDQGYLQLGSSGALDLFTRIPVTGGVHGTQAIYISHIFSLTMN
jgi:hypothetical protein